MGTVGPVTTPDRFRHVLGHFCTGVTVITTVDSEGPTGFTCQSFTALSLDPPLVLFCPTKSSTTWPRIERAGRFCANVLADEQREVARRFASRAPDKFEGVAWTPVPSPAPLPSSSPSPVPSLSSSPVPSGPEPASGPDASLPSGPPLLDGAVAWVDAEVETVHDGGDHWVVIGRVLDLGTDAALSPPLLFYRGRFTITQPESGTPELIDTLLAWPRHADWI
jgi:3-hydroxy-9,10-secoandrosta-1,3,5(10)-triene-9,17-dione monooxygenase reductase component